MSVSVSSPPSLPVASFDKSRCLAGLLCVSFVTSFCVLTPRIPAGAQSLPNLARGVSSALGGQGRLMWIDGTANVTRTVMINGAATVRDYTTTPEGVADVVRKCKAAHINTLIVDVKPASGQVLYRSRIAPRLKVWKGHPVPDFDVLAAFITEGHKAGLQVDASINVLSDGHKFFRTGLAYTHPEWQSLFYTLDRGMVAPDGARLPIRVAGEPSDLTRATLLDENSTVLGGEPTGLVGLDTSGTDPMPRPEGGEVVGQQLNIVIDGGNRVTGVVDSALLGDDALTAPSSGRIITATQPADLEWVGKHLRPGVPVRFDMRTALTPVADAPSQRVTCFVNPLHPEVRAHELEIVREIVSNYAIDGLVLDRCRYSDLYSDFSERTRAAFARFMGRPIRRWPQDVFAFSSTPGGDNVPGPLFGAWTKFRARVIRSLVAEIAHTVRRLKPGIALGTYVGSWYPDYYVVGVNWGSEQTNLRYTWYPPDYQSTGYAEFFDWISPGCYYKVPTRFQAREEGRSERGTVEYAAELSGEAVANGAFIYPGVYVKDYVEHPETFVQALEAAMRQSQGFMIFDLSWVDTYGWWLALEKMDLRSATPPDRIPDLLSMLRGVREDAY